MGGTHREGFPAALSSEIVRGDLPSQRVVVSCLHYPYMLWQAGRVDFLQLFASVAAVALCALAVAIAAGSRWRGSAPLAGPPPIALPAVPALIGAEELARLRGELATAIAELFAIRAEWRAHQKTLDGYLEAFEDLEESVERRRRRAAASASKMKSAEPEQQMDPNDRNSIRERARARGFRV